LSKSFQDIIISLEKKDIDFNSIAIDIFHHQKENNPVYRDYLKLIHFEDSPTMDSCDIPMFPIEFFKTSNIKTGEWLEEVTFKSSGTTGKRSTHFIQDVDFYHSNARHIFEEYIGPVKEYEFLGLLPNYQSNPDSSLISMVDYFISLSRFEGGYFLEDQEGLYEHLEGNKEKNRPTVLFGVSFALMEYAQQFKHSEFFSLTVIETGGMKKHAEEITREQLQNVLKGAFEGSNIVSEYGMTECHSQMYALNDSQFHMNDRMRVLIADPTDPFRLLPIGQKGRIHIIDLANVSTISFIATDDIGLISSEGKVEILGRLSNSDLRGCNYLI
jgi:hypothetical protein